ncbi:MAG: hypothetical protein ACRCSI_00625 [Eubacterium aggregans]
MDEPEPEKGSGGVIAPDPGPLPESDPVREPASSCNTEAVLEELKGWEESSDHYFTAVIEMSAITGTYGLFWKGFSQPPYISRIPT